MRYSTHLILFSFFLTSVIFSQSELEQYSLGMENFNKGNYSNALTHFYNVLSKDDVDEKLLSSTNIYIGESLLGIQQKDGAIAQFENFVNKFPTSNFRELALYRLGNLYFEKKLYDKMAKYCIS